MTKYLFLLSVFEMIAAHASTRTVQYSGVMISSMNGNYECRVYVHNLGRITQNIDLRKSQFSFSQPYCKTVSALDFLDHSRRKLASSSLDGVLLAVGGERGTNNVVRGDPRYSSGPRESSDAPPSSGGSGNSGGSSGPTITRTTPVMNPGPAPIGLNLNQCGDTLSIEPMQSKVIYGYPRVAANHAVVCKGVIVVSDPQPNTPGSVIANGVLMSDQPENFVYFPINRGEAF